MTTRPLPLTAIRDAIASTPALLIAVGFDATLCSVADTTDSKATSGRTMLALQRLTKSTKVTLAVLSGLALDDIRAKIDHDAIFAGNQGLEIGGKGFDFVHPEAERVTSQVRQVCETLQSIIAAWPGAWVQDKRLTAAVHVRDCSVDHWTKIRDAIRTVVRPIDDLFCLRAARAAFEISPRIGWDKGSALKYIERQLGTHDSLTLCIGDDDTDEPMFRAVSNGIGVRVGPTGETDALYTLPDTAALTELFEWIAETVETTPRRTGLSRFHAGDFAPPVQI
jgi:trehalose 6-phosphate phosphatase